ncbi:MAG: DUF72 domain-containing protein [Anaerolineales bacterium]
MLVGTSGFSYKDWIGPVYPASLPEKEWLGYLARQFPTVELNVTFYRVPSVRTVAGWVDKTPEGFLFSVKAFQGLTHDRQGPDFAGFLESLRPLSESGKLGCVLAQFPYSFHDNAENREYLARLREGLGDLPLVVEFRNGGWVRADTFGFLRGLKLGFCNVDEPALKGLMPRVCVSTGPVGYVRFHGRNAAKWFEHEQAWQRYDYTYSREELGEWVPRLKQLEEETEVALVYFNNHFRGQAVQGARDLLSLLGRG